MSIGQFMPHIWPDDGKTPDPFWSYVVAALHMDAFDSNGMPIDVSPVAKTYTRGGVPTVDTGTKLLGSGSYYFSGTGQYFNSVTRSEFNLGTANNFTIEFWINTQGNGTQYQVMCSHATNSTWNEPRIALSNALSGGKYRVQLNVNQADRILSGYVITPGQWHHISYGRAAGSRWFMYVDGVLSGTWTNSGTTMGSMSLCLGTTGFNQNTAATDKYKGWLDEFRWWNGISIRDGINNFTPPTAPWADS